MPPSQQTEASSRMTRQKSTMDDEVRFAKPLAGLCGKIAARGTQVEERVTVRKEVANAIDELHWQFVQIGMLCYKLRVRECLIGR